MHAASWPGSPRPLSWFNALAGTTFLSKDPARQNRRIRPAALSAVSNGMTITVHTHSVFGHREDDLRISVIIPTYNRPKAVARCLEALSRIRAPEGGFEVIVVNDGGIPPPDAAVLACREGTPVRVRVLDQANRGPAAARNAGADAASGTILAFTDDDCVPRADWLAALDDALLSNSEALVGGHTVNVLTDNPYSAASQALAEFVMAYFDGGARGRFFTSNNVAMAKERFLELGGFDSSFPSAAGEDRDLCDRWSAEGWPSVRVPEAVVDHEHALSPRTFVRQHFNYGRGGRVFRKVRVERGRPVLLDPGFYLASVRHGYRWPRSRGGLVAALTIAAHGAYAGGMAYELLRGTVRAKALA